MSEDRRDGGWPYNHSEKTDEKYPDVNQPDHYTVGGIEAIDVIKAKLTPEEFIGYCKGSGLKYLMRANYKGKHDQDVLKAQYYLNRAQETIEELEEAAAQSEENDEYGETPEGGSVG